MTSSREAAVGFEWPALDHELAVREPAPEGAWTPPELGSGRRPGGGGAPRSSRDEAYARGHEDGLRDGEAMAAQALAPALRALHGVARAMAEARDRFETDRMRNLHALSLAVARRLFQRELQSDPGVVRDLVAQALDLLPPEGPVDVHINPVDLASLAGALEELHAAGRGLTLQWLADPVLERGSFVLETPARIVDGRVDVALRTLYERLGHD